MWANTQRHGRHAEYRWRPLFNAATFGWRPLLDCRSITMTRRKTRRNLHGCLKLPNRSHQLMGRSSPHCEDIWGRYCCLRIFFSDWRYVPQLLRYSPTKLCDGAEMMRFMVALSNRADNYIFALWFLSSSFFFSSPNLSGRILNVYHTSPQGVTLVRI